MREERDELRIQNTELITLTKEQFKQLKERRPVESARLGSVAARQPQLPLLGGSLS